MEGSGGAGSRGLSKVLFDSDSVKTLWSPGRLVDGDGFAGQVRVGQMHRWKGRHSYPAVDRCESELK